MFSTYRIGRPLSALHRRSPRPAVPAAALFPAAALCLLAAAAHAQVNVATYHNDNARTGANLNETVLTPANVNSTRFGKLFSYALDSIPPGQPLNLSGISIRQRGARRRLCHDPNASVYAFDADSDNGGRPLWHLSFINPAGGIVPGDPGTGATSSLLGIVSTPVMIRLPGRSTSW